MWAKRTKHGTGSAMYVSLSLTGLSKYWKSDCSSTLKMTGKVMDYATEIIQGWEGMTNGMGPRGSNGSFLLALSLSFTCSINQLKTLLSPEAHVCFLSMTLEWPINLNILYTVSIRYLARLWPWTLSNTFQKAMDHMTDQSPVLHSRHITSFSLSESRTWRNQNKE